MILFNGSIDLAYYKKTSELEVSKRCMTLHFVKCQSSFQGRKKAIEMPTFHYMKSDTSICEVDLQNFLEALFLDMNKNVTAILYFL